MTIRRAEEKDIPRLIALLYQVHRVHAQGRPDIFRLGNKKYTEEELSVLLKSEQTPIYVAVNEDDCVCGYAFCVYQEIKDDISLMDMKTLYIDDLCVDEKQRGQRIGTSLYEYVLSEAKRMGCYHVTLNVWCLNESAMRFYEKCGLSPLKITMEKIL